MSSRTVKHAIDIAGAAIGLVLLAPVLAAVAIAVHHCLGRPVLFRQTRPGYQARPFTIYKFRTMRDVVDSRGLLLPDTERLHPLGAFLRRMSLDELPELWNVLKGDMSLIGPRPLLPEYLPRYSEFQRRRHEAKPGITGWAQVNGRNSLAWERKFELDVWYVDHWSLALDLRILFATVGSVFRRAGIAHPGQTTMGEFIGTGDKSEKAHT